MVSAFVLALHLVCVNIASAGPLVCLGFEVGESRGGKLAGRVGRWLAMATVIFFILGIVLGLLMGAFVWNDAFARALSLLSRRVYFGVIEIVFSLVLMFGYALWWRFSKPKVAIWVRVLRCSLPLLAATNLLYHFPMLFSILADLANRSRQPAEALTSAEFRELAFSPELVSRSIHFTLASFAVCGALLMVYALWRTKENSSPLYETVGRWGGWLALIPTALQLPVGLWVLFESPNIWQTRLMGGDLTATLLFGVSVGGAFWLLHAASSVAIGDATRRAMQTTIALMLIIILLMTGVLLSARVANNNVSNASVLSVPS